jgi:hypothetical protein
MHLGTIAMPSDAATKLMVDEICGARCATTGLNPTCSQAVRMASERPNRVARERGINSPLAKQLHQLRGSCFLEGKLDIGKVPPVSSQRGRHDRNTAWEYRPVGITAAQMNLYCGLAVMALRGDLSAADYTDGAISPVRAGKGQSPPAIVSTGSRIMLGGTNSCFA